MEATKNRASRPVIGVSSCLLGNRVRYDGSDRLSHLVTSQLGQLFELTAFCPEMEIGLGVPREPIHLVRTSEGVRCQRGELDFTQRLTALADERQNWLNSLDGYVFKARSPSCGIASTKIDGAAGEANYGWGIFAARVAELYPQLALIEDTSLEDRSQYDSFVQKVWNRANHRRG